MELEPAALKALDCGFKVYDGEETTDGGGRRVDGGLVIGWLGVDEAIGWKGGCEPIGWKGGCEALGWRGAFLRKGLGGGRAGRGGGTLVLGTGGEKMGAEYILDGGVEGRGADDGLVGGCRRCGLYVTGRSGFV